MYGGTSKLNPSDLGGVMDKKGLCTDFDGVLNINHKIV